MHKDLQLCAQAAQALELCLSEIDDDSLAGLVVIEVEPAPDSTRLRVVLGIPLGTAAATITTPAAAAPVPRLPPPPPLREPLLAARAALARHERRLRAEMAAMIHRKRAPELAFFVVPLRPPVADGGGS